MKPDVLEPNPRSGWIAGPSRFIMTARAVYRHESSGDRVYGQTRSLWKSLTNIRTDAITSDVWCSKDSRRGKYASRNRVTRFCFHNHRTRYTEEHAKAGSASPGSHFRECPDQPRNRYGHSTRSHERCDQG